MPFADVKFQDGAIDRLQRSLAGDRVSHAYLFEGPEGVGKEMLASRFAQVLLCSKPTKVKSGDGQHIDACGQCDDCRIFLAGNHPDYIRVHRMLAKMHPDALVRNRKATQLGIDVIRHFLIDAAAHSPVRGRTQVFVVVEAERLNNASQNALLKTLEEPPGKSHIILLSTPSDDLLATTRSRCQLVTFRPLPSQFVEETLVRQKKAPADAARFLAEMAEGRLGLALRYFDAGLFAHVPEVLECLKQAQDDPLAAAKRIESLSKAIAEASKRAETGAQAEEVEADTDGDAETEIAEEEERPKEKGDVNVVRESQTVAMALLTTVLRDVLRITAGSTAMALPREPIVRRLAEASDSRCVSQAIRGIAEATIQIDSSINIGLMFDGVGIALNRGLAPMAALSR